MQSLHLLEENIATVCVAVYCTGAVVEEDRGPLLRGVCFAALDSHQEGLLWDVCPAFVVMYDPDVAFIRQLEVILALQTLDALAHTVVVQCGMHSRGSHVFATADCTIGVHARSACTACWST